MKTITLDMLYALDACQGQINLFGQEVIVTPDACEQVAELFNWDWAAQHLLPGDLQAEYQRQCAPLWAECNRKRALLWTEYQRQYAPLLAGYERKRALLWTEYQYRCAPLLAECMRRHARLFATLYLEAA
jgi:hypothetical protein